MARDQENNYCCDPLSELKISIKGEDEQEKLLEGMERDVYVCVHTLTRSCFFMCFQGILLKPVQ